MNSNLSKGLGQPILSSSQNPPSHSSSDQPFLTQVAQLHPAHQHTPTWRNERVMYSSTIQLPTSGLEQRPLGLGLGGLDKLGRSVVEETEADSPAIKENSLQMAQKLTKPLTFRNDRNPRSKMAASSIFPPKASQNPNVLAWPSALKNENNGGFKKQGIQLGLRGGVVSGEEESNSQAEQRRKRQILGFKKEVDLLNRKIQHTFAHFSTTNKQTNDRPYFQLPSRRNQQEIIPPSFSTAPQIKNDPIPQHFEHNTQPALKQVNVNQLPNILQQSIMPYFPQENPPTSLENLFKKKNVYLNEDLLKCQLQEPNKIIIKQKIDQPKPQSLLFIQVETPPRLFRKSDFAIGRRMGKGQFGEVMMVIHRATGFLCGMKVMSKQQIREEKYSNQIARQLSIQFYLAHRFIAPLYGYFEDEENLYLLVEFCTDGQLLQRLRQAHRLEEKQTSIILREVCEGLDYIHKEQIIHRDVKPENILFQLGTVKISDFGWAVHAGNAMRKTVSGTPLYYSPELVMQTEYDEKIDVWSVGLMAYECLIGRIPFKIYSEFDLNRIVSDDINFPEYVDISEQAKHFILNAMHKKPQDRLDIRQMLRHPFISKYRAQGASEACIQEMRRLLNN